MLVAGETDRLPLVPLLPVHPPEAVHDVAFVLDQVRVDDWPLEIDEGEAVIDTVGTLTAVTVTAALALEVPPAPIHRN